jgi:hypothetical protein
MYAPDCDMAMAAKPDFDCSRRDDSLLGPAGMGTYLDAAWDDFIEHQLKSFGEVPVVLAIGNHELRSGRTRDEYRRKFEPWLTAMPIHLQRSKDYFDGIDPVGDLEGATYFHFVVDGVDFVTLDNADATSFSAAQMRWLARLLARDAKDTKIDTIVVGMHAALPFSKSRHHAMDDTCQGQCSGQAAYNLLVRAQQSSDTNVYVMASHSHYFQEDIFGGQPEHHGQELPGWILGTAGAEQLGDAIHYGYALVAVHPDHTLSVRFRELGRDAPPIPTGPEGPALTKFCYEQNKRPLVPREPEAICACGEAD